MIKIFKSPIPISSFNLRLTYNGFNDLTQKLTFKSPPIRCRSRSTRSFCSLCHRHNMQMQPINREITNLLTSTRTRLNQQIKLLPCSRLSSSKGNQKGSQSIENKEQLKFTQTKGQDFKVFEDKGQVIQDIFEKEWNPISYEGLDLDREINEMEEIKKYKKQRGETGIFDLEELVEVLNYEGARDLAVIKIPDEVDWANYMVCCSMKTARHMFAIATAIRKICKNKEKKKGEKIPEIEGKEGSEDWIAIDLGNIILQIFSREYRKIIDLETLWTVGPEFDDITNMKESEIVQLLNMDFSQYIKLRDEKRAAEAGAQGLKKKLDNL